MHFYLCWAWRWKVTKEHYNADTDQITLIGSNVDVVNFYEGLDEDDIESTGRLILIVQELMNLNRSRESEKRLLKKLLFYIQIN